MSTPSRSSSANGESREAPALPAKRGELGYIEQSVEVDLSSGTDVVLNAGPHPAEQNAAASSSVEESRPEGQVAQGAETRSPSRVVSPVDPGQKAVFQSWRSTKPNRRFGGLANATVLRLAAIVVGIGIVVLIWAFAAKILEANARAMMASYNTDPTAPDAYPADATPSLAFVHISFSVAVLILLVFLERAVFRARIDRYAYKHPGMLPRYRYRRGFGHRLGGESMSESSSWRSIPYAPWNRPPLPTYAAAMNIRGTGDVEDEIIGAPPPPAYGNTRGSTLLLTGIPGLREGQQVPDSPPPPMSDDGHGGNNDTRLRESRRVSVASSLRSFILSLGRSMSDDNVESSSPARVEGSAQTPGRLEEGQAPPKSEARTSRQA